MFSDSISIQGSLKYLWNFPERRRKGSSSLLPSSSSLLISSRADSEPSGQILPVHLVKNACQTYLHIGSHFKWIKLKACEEHRPLRGGILQESFQSWLWFSLWNFGREEVTVTSYPLSWCECIWCLRTETPLFNETVWPVSQTHQSGRWWEIAFVWVLQSKKRKAKSVKKKNIPVFYIFMIISLLIPGWPPVTRSALTRVAALLRFWGSITGNERSPYLPKPPHKPQPPFPQGLLCPCVSILIVRWMMWGSWQMPSPFTFMFW